MSDRGLHNYEIVRLIGSGGMGQVYEAIHGPLGRRVALKTLHEHADRDATALRRFIREAENVAQIEHENVVRIYEMFEHGETRYLALEFVDGGDLAAALQARPGPWPVDVALTLLVGVSSGLAEAHQKGIVHRDIKPANILVTRKGCPKLTDFGLAWRDRVETRVTQTGTVLGTVGYMSPEQWRGEEVGPASDVYSLGLVAFRILTGRSPFRRVEDERDLRHPGFDRLSVADTGVHQNPDVAGLVDRMLATDPKDRPTSLEIAETFERILLDSETVPRTRTERERALRAHLDSTPRPDDAVDLSPTVPLASTGEPSSSSRTRVALWIGSVLVVVLGSVGALEVTEPRPWERLKDLFPGGNGFSPPDTSIVDSWTEDPEEPTSDPPQGWVDLRLSARADVRDARGQILVEDSDRAIVPAPPGSVSGWTASTEHFEDVPLPDFDVTAGDTSRLDIVHLWGSVRFNSPPGVRVDVGEDSETTPCGFYLARGLRTFRVEAAGRQLSKVLLSSKGRDLQTVPFRGTEHPHAYEFDIELEGDDEMAVGMIFEEASETD